MTTVKDIMHTSALQVSENALVKEVARNIFSSGIPTVPVVSGKKLVGILSEEDILEHMYPGIQEIASDKKKVKDVNWMQKQFLDLLNSPVKKIMNKKVVTISANADVVEAQEIMLRYNYSRVPVVSTEGDLLGMISAADVFKQVIKHDLFQLERDRYAMFMAEHYDKMIDWDQRFDAELPSLLRLFQREKVKDILDLGVWTGSLSIALAQKGFTVTGLENNKLMLDVANTKRNKLPEEIKKKTNFIFSDYKSIASDRHEKYDAAISLGNALLYLPEDILKIFQGVHKVLRKNGIVVLQVLNTDRVLGRKNRLLNFQIQKGKNANERMFLEFLDKKDAKTIRHNLTVFDSETGGWEYKGETSLDVRYLQEKDISKALQAAGFTEIFVSGYQSEYQGEYTPIPFIKPYDPATSDWMVFFARKKN